MTKSLESDISNSKKLFSKWLVQPGQKNQGASPEQEPPREAQKPNDKMSLNQSAQLH